MTENNIIIFGAGPSGMAAAFELSNNKRKVTIIEKNDTIGGLGRTFHYGDFITDLGPHRFFSQNKYLYDFIEDLLGEDWIVVNRLTRFFINGKFFSYPVDIKNALFNVGFTRGIHFLSDYIYQRIKEKFISVNPRNFEELIISDFGRSLAELNMLNYTEKVWGLPCTQISTDWASQRIKDLSLIAVIKKAIFEGDKGPKTLVDQFYYPRFGTGTIFDSMLDKMRKGDNTQLLLNSYPKSIHHNEEKITQIKINNNGIYEDFYADKVISSIPITEFLKILNPAPPESILVAASRLKFRSHVTLFLTINKEEIFPDQWIYFPNLEVPFGRVMEPKNFSKELSPEGKTSLLIEFFCWETDDIWRMDSQKLCELSLTTLEKYNFLQRTDIIDAYVHKERFAYPVYDLEYQKNVNIIMDYLQNLKNLTLVGRGGRFRYNNLDHALEMGILAARGILENKSYDIDEIGAGKDYFERGYIQT
ncbi:MAG: NAD(P)-binding protein [Methanomicrobiales archaeon]|jgi:protoporphyrinogen oxidase|nr:NAD(P)-binding protein [Methanomicrobiales archaeon]